MASADVVFFVSTLRWRLLMTVKKRLTLMPTSGETWKTMKDYVGKIDSSFPGK